MKFVKVENKGIIGINESSENMQKMKKMYEDEFRKIEIEQKKTNISYKSKKWKVRIGTGVLTLGLTFSRNKFKHLGKIGVLLLGKLTQKILTKKNKEAKKNFEKKKNQLTADFINEDGIFKQFNISKYNLAIQEIDSTNEDLNEKSLGF